MVGNRVIKEDRVHGLAHRVVPSKREGDVRQATRRQHMRTGLSNQTTGFNEILGIVVMLFDASRNSKNIWVKNDVLGREPGNLSE